MSQITTQFDSIISPVYNAYVNSNFYQKIVGLKRLILASNAWQFRLNLSMDDTSFNKLSNIIMIIKGYYHAGAVVVVNVY